MTMRVTRLGGTATTAEALHMRAEQSSTSKKPSTEVRVDVRDLQAQLWPGDPSASEKLDALVALGSRIRDKAGHPVLSARYHLFVRATEGAFVSFGEAGPRIFLGRHEIDPETGRAVFEFGTCSRCGAVHLSGEVDLRGRQEYFIPTKKADGAVNWLVLADANVGTLVDEDEVTLEMTTQPRTSIPRQDFVHRLRTARRRGLSALRHRALHGRSDADSTRASRAPRRS